MMNKRILSFLLAVMLIVGLMPTSVFATENEGEPAPTPVIEPAEGGEDADGIALLTEEGSEGEEGEDAEPCTVCNEPGCEKTHTQCEACGTWDCEKTHTQCEVCDAWDCTEHKPCALCGAYDCGGEHEYCTECDKYNCGIDHNAACDKCGVPGCTAEHKFCDTCSKYDCGIDHTVTEPTDPSEPPMMAPAPEEETLFDKLMAAESVEDMYIVVLDYMQNDPQTLMGLTAEEIADLKDRINELDPEGDDADTADLLDTLAVLPNGGEELEGDPETLEWIDDHTFTTNETINNAITIANNDVGGEANWTFQNGTVTINATITIPKGQSLDILVAANDNDGIGLIKAGPNLGNKPMFDVQGRLKIAKTNNNDGQNHGSIEINGGTIKVASGAELDMENISKVSGTTTWDIASGGKIYIRGAVPVTGTLSIKGTANIERYYTDGAMFSIRDGATLNIEGSSKDSLVIDGKNREAAAAVIDVKYNGAQYTNKISNVSLKNVKFKDCTSLSGSAAINLSTYTTSNLNVNNCTFYNCDSVSGGAIYFNGYARCNATIKNSIFDGCTTQEGGAIRTNGAGGVYALVEQCIFKNNQGTNSSSHGGAIYWNACGTRADGNTAKMDIWDCQFIGNSSNEYAGAVFNESFMDIGTRYDSNFTMSESVPGSIRGTLITGNSAKYGGGIQVPTYGGDMRPHDGVGAELTLKTGVFIIGNTAEYGGGLAMRVGKGTIGNTPEQIATVNFKINVEGAVIRDNTATKMGGGIYLDRMAGYDLYPSTVNVKSGTITGNSAPKGGAICVYNENNAPSAKTNKVTIGAVNETLLIENNTATGGDALGGAVYISYGDVEMVNGNVQKNQAKHGGAICVDNGQFALAGGSLNNNTAEDKGGAAYVIGGDFTMSGGIVEINSANDGGAAYVDGGNFAMSGGDIRNNSATSNGGALYVNGGDFTMTSGTMTENKATGTGSNGGGAYVKGGNVVIGVQGCTGKGDNHTVAPTDKAHPLVENNSAVDSGGGIALIGNGNITMYCGDIINNEATNRGRGLNIYMEAGTFDYWNGDVGELDAPELVIVGGSLVNHKLNGTVTLKYYHCNEDHKHSADAVAVKTAYASKEAWFNLPDGEKYWTAADGYRFFGWTFNGDADSDQNRVRSKDDYQPLGTPIQALDQHDTTADDVIHMYALWAPETSTITYAGSIVDGNYVSETLNNPSSNPKSYTFTVGPNEVTFAAPVKAGYTFKGWYIYQNLGQNANWGYEPAFKAGETASNTNYAGMDYAKMEFLAADANGNVTLEMGTTFFGNITLVAEFEAAFTDLRIKKSGWNSTDENQTFLFKVTGTPKNTSLGKINMTVTVHGNGNTLIKQLPVGDYRVEEIGEWSWRYTSDGTKTIKLEDPAKIDDKAVTVEFKNTRTEDKWLSGDCIAENQWPIS